MSKIETVCVLDWSFCVIHTFCAIQSWWRFRRPGEDFPEPWWEHEEVLKTFRKRCGDMLKEFQKKYKADIYYICKDCPRSEIWRLSLDPQYKSNRDKDEMSGTCRWSQAFIEADAILKSLQGSMRFMEVGVRGAEADDCVSVVCDYCLTSLSDPSPPAIHVVTGDSDLYQLEMRPGITVWDRKGRLWRDRMKGMNPKEYIEAKCYAGDVSDGIPSVGPRIGLKTALGWIKGTRKWPKDESRINKKRLELNKALIMFEYIPEVLKNEILRRLNSSQF